MAERPSGHCADCGLRLPGVYGDGPPCGCMRVERARPSAEDEPLSLDVIHLALQLTGERCGLCWDLGVVEIGVVGGDPAAPVEAPCEWCRPEERRAWEADRG